MDGIGVEHAEGEFETGKERRNSIYLGWRPWTSVQDAKSLVTAEPCQHNHCPSMETQDARKHTL
jgi:hypothetical protein